VTSSRNWRRAHERCVQLLELVRPAAMELAKREHLHREHEGSVVLAIASQPSYRLLRNGI
jgi:hypothetical protein